MRFAITFGMLVLTGCGGDPTAQSVCDKEAEQQCASSPDKGSCLAELGAACLTNYYFKAFQPLSCPGNSGGTKIRAKLEAGIFQGEDIGENDLLTETRGLQRYFAPYELWFLASKGAEHVGMRQVMNGNIDEINSALRKEGIDPYGSISSTDQAKVMDIVSRVMFAPLQEFVAKHGVPAVSGTANIVILESIVDSSFSKLFLSNGEIAGLGISKTVFDKTSGTDPNKNLYKLLGIRGDFTPTLFVGHKTIMKYTAIPDAIVAHEMGHALGLEHTSQSGNLMVPAMNAADPCPPAITVAQSQAMVGLDRTALTLSADLDNGLEKLISLHKAIVDYVMSRNQ